MPFFLALKTNYLLLFPELASRDIGSSLNEAWGKERSPPDCPSLLPLFMFLFAVAPQDGPPETPDRLLGVCGELLDLLHGSPHHVLQV